MNSNIFLIIQNQVNILYAYFYFFPYKSYLVLYLYVLLFYYEYIRYVLTFEFPACILFSM